MEKGIASCCTDQDLIGSACIAKQDNSYVVDVIVNYQHEIGVIVASDFEYIGIINNQHTFTEKSTGMQFTMLSATGQEVIELLDGDRVIIPNPNSSGERTVYSIRENRGLQHLRGDERPY